MELNLSQWEILLILVHRCERKAQEVAEGLGLSQYTYLSRLYKRESLPSHLIQKAATFFNMPETIFEKTTLTGLTEQLKALSLRVRVLETDKTLLEARVTNLSARLEECEEKKRILSAKSN